MGRSLDELITVGYLSEWDFRPMVTKEGYKLILLPGDELLHVLAISQRKQLLNEKRSFEANDDEQAAIRALLDRGVSSAKATTLTRTHDPLVIMDQIEYAEFLISQDKRRKFDNPAGFIIYSVENGVPVPTNFVTSRRRKEQEQRARIELEDQAKAFAREQEYEAWRDQQVNAELSRRFPETVLATKIKQLVRERVRSDERFGRMLPEQQQAMALQLLRAELRNEIALPSFEDWQQSFHQMPLFSASSGH
jgi:hypothetical protein